MCGYRRYILIDLYVCVQRVHTDWEYVFVYRRYTKYILTGWYVFMYIKCLSTVSTY